MRYIGIASAFLAGLLLGEVAGLTGLLAGGVVVAAMGAVWILSRERTAPGVRDASEGWRAVELELSRARRMERTFCLARIEVGRSARSTTEKRLLTGLRRSLRDIDVAWWSGSDLLVLLAETTSSRVSPMFGRLQEWIPSPWRWSIAEFPRDGLTLQALLAALDENAESTAQLEVSDGAL